VRGRAISKAIVITYQILFPTCYRHCLWGRSPRDRLAQFKRALLVGSMAHVLGLSCGLLCAPRNRSLTSEERTSRAGLGSVANDPNRSLGHTMGRRL